MSEMKLAVMGAAGRMGRALIQAIAAADGCVLAGAAERPGSDAIGTDAGRVAGLEAAGVAIIDDPLALFTHVDGVIDFTTPATSVALAGLAAQARIVHVIGTTGFSAEEDAKVLAAARHATIVKSGNMSLGINVLAALTRKLAETLGPDFDIEILEMHHRHKVDAPSGTALMLGQAAAYGREVALDQVGRFTRHGHTGARASGEIGFATLRGGSVVGDHSVIFASAGERITLSHQAEDRGIFARGAVHAARWARGKPPGLYTMADVLGL